MEPKNPKFRPHAADELSAAHENLNARAHYHEMRTADLPTIRREGEAALRRLLPVAQRDTGQSSVVARFLMCLYNGNRFPFDLTDLRRLDTALFDDCIAVLRMDFQPVREVHCYFENGGKIWEELAEAWGFTDYAGGSWR